MIDVVTKICPRCGVKKALSQFNEDSKTLSGLKCHCRSCQRELCRIDYQKKTGSIPRRYYNRESDLPGYRTCNVCGKSLDLSLFPKRAKSPDGKGYTCKECHRNQQIEFNKAHPEAMRARHLYKNYGITVDEYNQLYKQQGGVCMICKKPETRTRMGKLLPLSVDHCDKTGRIRGLLCTSCNPGIGHFDHNCDLLECAIKYIKYANTGLVVPQRTLDRVTKNG